MDIRSVRLMSDDQLLDAIEDKRLELFNLRFQQVSAEVENTNQLRHAKRDLAHLLTVRRERELAMKIAEGEDRDAE